MLRDYMRDKGEGRKYLGRRLVKRRETGGKVVNPAEKTKGG
jgi:hypothetical protein